jgi:L-alanine-DL-glutamate epimerase-like enolase superfamily enzyme
MIPFTIATATMHFAQNVFIRLQTSEGITGVGECSAFPMIAGETQDTCLVLAKEFAQLWKGKNALDIDERLTDLDRFIAGNHTIKSAFDMALYDIAAKEAGLPLYKYLGGYYFEPESDITVGISDSETMVNQAVNFVDNLGATILKIKLGKSPSDDIQRIAAIRKAVGDKIKIRIDANQGWSYENAIEALKGMEAYDIQFCEQPMPVWMDELLPVLKNQTGIPIMADESVFDDHDARRLIRQNACDLVNIKLSKSGGIKGALAIHNLCEASGIPNMLGGMLESRLALSAIVHFALACKNIKYYDLDTCLLGHLEDPVLDGVQFKRMLLRIPDLPGIGADVDDAFLRNCESFEI